MAPAELPNDKLQIDLQAHGTESDQRKHQYRNVQMNFFGAQMTFRKFMQVAILQDDDFGH